MSVFARVTEEEVARWRRIDDHLKDATQACYVRGLEEGRGEHPLPMVLHCPSCRAKHVDKPDPDSGWTNPPHKSHKCRACLTIWRPADICTTGVEAIATRGQADTYP